MRSRVLPLDSGVDLVKILTGLLSERRIYRSPEACSPAKVSKMTFPTILSHLENLTDFCKTVETGQDPHL